MTTSFVRHTVADYDQWRQGFDAFHDSRNLPKPIVYRGADNPADVTVVGTFDSLDEAQSFLNGAEVREAMKASGVENPQIWFADEAN
jgi:hypothetical protein